jgi:hypothetical protein
VPPVPAAAASVPTLKPAPARISNDEIAENTLRCEPMNSPQYFVFCEQRARGLKQAAGRKNCRSRLAKNQPGAICSLKLRTMPMSLITVSGVPLMSQFGVSDRQTRNEFCASWYSVKFSSC